MKTLLFRAAWLSLLCFCLGAHAERLSIPGSGNPEYVLNALAQAFNARQSQHQVLVPSSTGTAGALREVEQGTATLGRVGRPLKAAERDSGLSYFSLGRDAVAVAGGAAVTAQGISRAQLYDVYVGKITDWRELGGKPGPIRAIGREATNAARQAIEREIKSFATIKFHENVKVVHLDPQLIELMDRFPTSLGFLNRSGLMAAHSKLALLELDGVAPTAENLAAGRYPLWMEFGLAFKSGNLTDAGRAFLTFVESAEGVRIRRAHGLLVAVADMKR